MLLKGYSVSFSNEHDMCMFCLKRSKGKIYSISLLTDWCFFYKSKDKAQGPMSCLTKGSALQGPRDLHLPV